jgi:hypothetical protein
MRHDEILGHVRDHFAQMLRRFRERSAVDGPANGLDLDALRASQGLSEDDPEDWATLLTHAEGADGLLRGFCEARCIGEAPEGGARALMLGELQKGYREYIARDLEHTAVFETLALEEPHSELPRAPISTVAATTSEPEVSRQPS